jgi:AcrR family transcriptional regulator
MGRGRPRNFDIDESLEKAMEVFWRKGYACTTIPDLTGAMGINRPSLYAAFGNKEKLFNMALDRYRSGPASYVNRAIAKDTAIEVFESLMTGVVELVTDPERPGGCLFVCAALAGSGESLSIVDELSKRRLAGEEDIRTRFEAAKATGDLPPNSDPVVLAKLAATMIWGLSVQAVGGASRPELMEIAKIAARDFENRFTISNTLNK